MIGGRATPLPIKTTRRYGQATETGIWGGMDGAPATQQAVKKDFSPAAYVAIIGVIALVVGGFAWNAITGTNGSHTRTISRSSYPGTWPLTLDSVTIGCDGHNPWVRVGGTFYALDGAGRSAGYRDIDPIWAYDANGDGLKPSLAPLRAEAEKLC